MPEQPSRLRYVEAAMQRWADGGVEALMAFLGPDVEWHPHRADRVLLGPEARGWVEGSEAVKGTLTTGKPCFEEYEGCVLVSVSLRDSRSRGFVESQRTLLYEFAGDRLIRVRSFGKRSQAETARRRTRGLDPQAIAG